MKAFVVAWIMALLMFTVGYWTGTRQERGLSYSRGYAAAADSCKAVARIDSMATAASVGVLATLVRTGADTSLVVLLPSGHIARVSK